MGMTDANGGAYNFQYDSAAFCCRTAIRQAARSVLARTTTSGNYHCHQDDSFAAHHHVLHGVRVQAGTSTGQNLGFTYPNGTQGSAGETQMSGQLTQNEALPTAPNTITRSVPILALESSRQSAPARPSPWAR